MNAPSPELAAFLVKSGLAQPGEDAEWVALTGGVSSDIWRVSLPSGELCVKRALTQLRVAATWKAPIERNATEWAFIQLVSSIAPNAVPKPIAHDPRAGLFAMEWLAPSQFRLWKSELLDGRVDIGFAAQVGSVLGTIHARTADEALVASRFSTDRAFHSLRVEPYLLTIARKHPGLAKEVRAIADRLVSTKRVLVHGDVSPKNIMIGPDGPVLLDAEVAWFGDPAFDLAFCLNHLVIKRRHLPEYATELASAFDSLSLSYLSKVDWERSDEIEARAAALLPVLSLARVDGKSPVEYLLDEERVALRSASIEAIKQSKLTLTTARELLTAC